MAQPFTNTAEAPMEIERFTTSAVATTATEVQLPDWTRQAVVTPNGGDVRVAVRGTDGAVLTADYVDIQDGASKPFLINVGKGRPDADRLTIYIAPDGTGAVVVAVEARAEVM